MEQLIKVINGEATIDSRIVAEGLGVDHSSVIRLIRERQAEIEKEFGRVGFEIVPSQTAGGVQNVTMVNLNEGQSLFVGTLCRNTPEAIAFKAKLVNEFLKHRQLLLQQQAFAPVANITKIDLAKMLIESEEQRISAEKKLLDANAKIEADASKVLLAESITASGDYYLIKEAAVYLTQNGYPVGQNQLFERLRFHGFLGQKGMNYNLPNHRGIELKLFHVKKTVIHTPDGQIKTRNTTYLTGRGLEYFLSFFLNQAKRA